MRWVAWDWVNANCQRCDMVFGLGNWEQKATAENAMGGLGLGRNHMQALHHGDWVWVWEMRDKRQLQEM